MFSSLVSTLPDKESLPQWVLALQDITWINKYQQSSTHCAKAYRILEHVQNCRLEALSKTFGQIIESRDTPGASDPIYTDIGARFVGPNGGRVLASAFREPTANGRDRYSNVFPYDDWRVSLKVGTPVLESVRNMQFRKPLTDAGHSQVSDYINASYVDTRYSGIQQQDLATLVGPTDLAGRLSFPGAKYGKRYIAAQGPLEETVRDFWAMIWEQNVYVVVMLTGVMEKRVQKCAQYWPAKGTREFSWDDGAYCDASGFTVSNGGTINARLAVTLIKEELCGVENSIALREFRVSGDMDGSAIERIVYQVHFLEWPDHSAANLPAIMAVLNLANDLQEKAAKQSKVGPMVVHCSAGVGRTGTYCTIDSVLYRLKQEKSDKEINKEQARKGDGQKNEEHAIEQDPIFQTVMTLRWQRMMMVQTITQFELCYEAILSQISEWK